MAYVINPDGTITTVPADYDRNGNLSIKRGYTFEGEGGSPKKDVKPAPANRRNKTPKSPNIPRKKNLIQSVSSDSGTQKKRPKTILLGEDSSSSDEDYRINDPTYLRRNHFKSSISEVDIEKFFLKRRRNNRFITNKEYVEILTKLKGPIAAYFASCYREYIKDLGFFNTIPGGGSNKTKKEKKRKGGKKNKQQKQVNRQPDNTPVTAPLLHKGRKPKYGYARDRFGRVQERDSFNEEKGNEFHQARNSQRNYDYSSFDANDDHDGAYSNWE